MSNEKYMVNTRLVALEALIRIEKNEFSHVVTREVLAEYEALDRIDRAFIKRLISGTESYKLQLDYILSRFINKDLAKLNPTARLVLRMSLYQILYMDSVPDSAACNEAAKLMDKKRLSGLKGLVNGVLRNIVRSKEGLLDFDNIKDKREQLVFKYSMPKWLVGLWYKEYGEDITEKMLKAFLEESPLTIRVNTDKISVEECKKTLTEEGILFEQHSYVPEALIVKDADNISASESFKAGLFQIQDVSSMLVGKAAAYKNGQQILDICAAPGGKSMHAASCVGAEGLVISNDLTEKKVRLIDENASRLGLRNIKTTVSDACVFNPEYEEKFDVVIADVPCSGLGVIGRKSDIKYRVKYEDIISLVELQRKILANAVKYVKKNGILMFSTCTVNRYENLDNLNWLEENFSLKRKGFEDLMGPVLQKEASAKEGYLQMIPGVHCTDGFFLAKLIKEEE